MGISETWLNAEIPNSFVALPSYNILRCDSKDGIRKHGVAFYIKEGIKYSLVDCNINNVLVLNLYEYNFYIVNVYRPPSNTSSENDLLVNFILDFCKNKEIVIVGDFNLPSIKWDLGDMSNLHASQFDMGFYSAFVRSGLEQIIGVPTIYPSGNVLDLFLTSDPQRVGDYNVLPPLPGCCHCPVIVSYVFQFCESRLDSVRFYNADRSWARGDYGLMAECLGGIDWQNEFHGLGVIDQYKVFLDILNPLIDIFIPKKANNATRRLPWSVNPPRSIIQARKMAWSEYKTSRGIYGRSSPLSLACWSKFQDINLQVKKFSIMSQANYERSLADQININPKLFHSYLKHRKKIGRPSIGPLKLGNGILTDDPSSMSDAFLEAFSSVFTTVSPFSSFSFANQRCSSLACDLFVTPADVVGIIDHIDANSSAGADGIHP